MHTCDDKMVSHPDHYISENGMEVIDVIKEFTSDLTGIEATDTGNVIKYILRWKNKNGLQDLKKARWYLDHLIDEVEKQAKASSLNDLLSYITEEVQDKFTVRMQINIEEIAIKEDDGK